MALFTDGPINTLADLHVVENAILGVASAENVDLAGKIAMAQDDIANQLVLFLLRRVPLRSHQWTDRRRKGVGDVVVTAPLRQWHTHKTLALVYQDAFNSQLNDRYRGKWAEYEELAKEKQRDYLHIGVGLAADPIPKAAVPALSGASGNATGATYYVQCAWVNQSGEEGTPSDAGEFTTSDGQQLVVTSVSPPANAKGWNVYVGTALEALALQNNARIAIDGSWTMTAGVRPGASPTSGQQPTWFVVDQQVVERG